MIGLNCFVRTDKLTDGSEVHGVVVLDGDEQLIHLDCVNEAAAHMLVHAITHNCVNIRWRGTVYRGNEVVL